MEKKVVYMRACDTSVKFIFFPFEKPFVYTIGLILYLYTTCTARKVYKSCISLPITMSSGVV